MLGGFGQVPSPLWATVSPFVMARCPSLSAGPIFSKDFPGQPSPDHRFLWNAVGLIRRLLLSG